MYICVFQKKYLSPLDNSLSIWKSFETLYAQWMLLVQCYPPGLKYQSTIVGVGSSLVTHTVIIKVVKRCYNNEIRFIQKIFPLLERYRTLPTLLNNYCHDPDRHSWSNRSHYCILLNISC